MVGACSPVDRMYATAMPAMAMHEGSTHAQCNRATVESDAGQLSSSPRRRPRVRATVSLTPGRDGHQMVVPSPPPGVGGTMRPKPDLSTATPS